MKDLQASLEGFICRENEPTMIYIFKFNYDFIAIRMGSAFQKLKVTWT